MAEGKARHGGPYDRGSADSYYGRGEQPHYYVGKTGLSKRVEQKDMTVEEIAEYKEGYDANEKLGHFKDWGNDYVYEEIDEDDE